MIDRATLLQPISPEDPSGEDLAFSELYDEIREVRREDVQPATTGIWAVEPKRAQWDQVVALSAEGLRTRSKDLQLAVWLAEGLMHQDGLKGLAEGIGLITALCEQFWDTLYPQIDDGDAEARLSQLLVLEGRVAIQLMQVPLTIADPQKDVQYTMQHMLAAQRIEPLSAANPRAFQSAIQSGDHSMASIISIAGRTPGEFYRDLLADLRSCDAELRALMALVENKCGTAAPGFTKLLGGIAQVQQTVSRLSGGLIGIDPFEEVPESQEDQDAQEDMPAVAVDGKIRSRQDAYRHLNDAANYLMETEPHSPVPYLIKRAIRWGNLPLGTLLSELLEDDEKTKRLFRLLSITAQ
jgi:type VI secretion system protein ImpA